LLLFDHSSTAKLNGIGPEAWLRHVPIHVADHLVNMVEDFLSWNFATQRVRPDHAEKHT
jgi:hypothetical protein